MIADLSQQSGLATNPTKAEVLSLALWSSNLSPQHSHGTVCDTALPALQVQAEHYEARTGINSRKDYEQMYKQSLDDPAAFWGKLAQDYHWQQKVDHDHQIHCVLHHTKVMYNFPWCIWIEALCGNAITCIFQQVMQLTW